jgi:hypothetical protein
VRPRPASPGERKLEALRATRARTGLFTSSTWAGWSTSDRWPTPPIDAPPHPAPTPTDDIAPSPLTIVAAQHDSPQARPTPDPSSDLAPACPVAEPATSIEHPDAPSAAAEIERSVPLWLEIAGASADLLRAEERRGLTMRFTFTTDGLLGDDAARTANAELLAFIERTPSAPIELAGSPTIAMEIVPFEPISAEPPHVGLTLPWPASYPYDSLRIPAFCPVDTSAEPSEPGALAEPPPHDALEPGPTEAPDPSLSDASSPSDRPPSATPAPPSHQSDRALGPDRADELLQRFAAGGEGEASMKAAAKGLRALAGIDLTPSIAALPSAHLSPDPSAPIPAAVDDMTPPATSPDLTSTRPARAPRRGLARSVVAFAAGLAGATVVVHVQPSFPDDVVALITHAIPAADPPSPSPSPLPAAEVAPASPDNALPSAPKQAP